jgi:hypothetical protein
MGRILFFILLVGTGWFLLNVIGVSIDPRGVGTTVQGREVILDADQLEARFSVTGAPISLESVTVAENGADLTRDVAPALNQTKLVLAQSVQIQDCQSLLR